MAPTLMGWVADLASLALTDCSIIDAAQRTKTGAIGGVLDCALLRQTGSGPKRGCAEPAWPPPLIASCARLCEARDMLPPQARVPRRDLLMRM